jgi:hypothetical protein
LAICNIILEDTKAKTEGAATKPSTAIPFKKGLDILEITLAFLINIAAFNIGMVANIFVVLKINLEAISANPAGPADKPNTPNPFKKGQAILETTFAVVINFTGLNIGTELKNLAVVKISLEATKAKAAGATASPKIAKPFKKGLDIRLIV